MATIRKAALRGWILLGVVLSLLALIRLSPPEFVEKQAHVKPSYPWQDLSQVLKKERFSASDYRLLYEQSGLGKAAVDALPQANRKEKILAFQKSLFAEVRFVCEANSIISSEERLTGPQGESWKGTEFADLKNGYILLTNASHTLNWRHGHAAIVVDAAEGKTLESVVLGTDSCVQNIDKWLHYPNFIVLKLKSASPQLLSEIANFAINNLDALPYSLTAGIFSAKYEPTSQLSGTQCAHLVWRAFMEFGYDLDSERGRIVTPKAIANSPLLEIVQVYGMDPRQIWP
jgi:uncharacterized protein YycO